jgi:hypothetical protein
MFAFRHTGNGNVKVTDCCHQRILWGWCTYCLIVTVLIVHGNSARRVLQAFKAKRKTARVTDVGGFSGMIKAQMKGRVKGIAWLMKQVVSIYADYLVQQKYMSRDGEIGQFENFNHFVYKWHISQFGLKQIAEMNLIDLIATVRANVDKHHQLQVQTFIPLLRSHAQCVKSHC